MGVTFLRLKVANPAQPRKAKDIEMLVDSGAVYSVLPADELKALGIKPTSKREFMLANGERITMPTGNAEFHYKGEIGAAPVVFGVEGVRIIGSTALASLGMTLDPIRRELLSLPRMLIMNHSLKDAA